MNIAFLLSVLALVASSVALPEPSRAKRKLEKIVFQNPTINVLITFSQGTAEVLRAISDTRFPGRNEKLQALGAALMENAEVSQARIKQVLTDFESPVPISYQTLWITNSILIQNATPQLLSVLVSFPEISDMVEDEQVPLHTPLYQGPVFRRQSPEAEWGIKKIQAEEALELLKTFPRKAASQIIVATIDTGVRVSHEALRDNFFGTYGWFDPYDRTESPNDNNGHGTHTTGTIAGKGGIGVFPNATWMACKGCAGNSCTKSALLQCGQFFVCPCLPDGSAKDCTKAPHIVSNSWGGGRGDPWFNSIIDAWQVAGIIPLFSLGNSGPACASANSPGDQPGVIGVGSTTVEDAISSFSSIGPATGHAFLKPDISAPGSNVVSAHHTADDAYVAMSGTSMACPHTAGLAAILLAYNSDLTFEGVKELLFDGAETQPLNSTGLVCSGLEDSAFPNYVYGHGRINCLNSLRRAISKRR